MTRFFLDLPVSIRVNRKSGWEHGGRTRDASSRGVFFYVDSSFVEGEPVEFILTVPPQITLGAPIRVHCAGRITRVDRHVTMQGVAATIDRYEFLREA